MSDPRIVAACRSFVRDLRGDLIELEFARHQVPKYKLPRIPSRAKRRAPKRETSVRHSGIVAVVLGLIDCDERDERALSLTESAAKQRLPDYDRFQLDIVVGPVRD